MEKFELVDFEIFTLKRQKDSAVSNFSLENFDFYKVFYGNFVNYGVKIIIRVYLSLVAGRTYSAFVPITLFHKDFLPCESRL